MPDTALAEMAEDVGKPAWLVTYTFENSTMGEQKAVVAAPNLGRVEAALRAHVTSIGCRLGAILNVEMAATETIIDTADDTEGVP